MTKEELLDYLTQLNNKMKLADIKGELHIYGGAVMCLVLEARQSTKDIDGWFVPTRDMRELIEEVANDNGIDKNWLNDGVKGFISSNDNTESFLSLTNLEISTALPEYVFAMKCMAVRKDADSKDIDDIKFLINYLGIKTYDEAIQIVLQYFPQNLISIRTQLTLEELFDIT